MGWRITGLNLKRIEPWILFIAICLLVNGYNAYTQKIQHALIPENSYSIDDRQNFQPKNKIDNLISEGTVLTKTYPDSAIRILYQAIVLSKHAKYTRGIVHCLMSLSIGYTTKGMYSTALALYDFTLKNYGQTSEGKKQTSLIYTNTGTVYQLMGNYKQSLLYYYKSLRLAEKSPVSPKELSRNYINLAGMLNQQNESRKSLYYLEQAEQIALRTQSHEHLAHALNNKGVAYLQLKDTTKAKSSFYASYILSKKFDFPHILQISITNLSSIYLSTGELDKAISILKSSANSFINSHQRIWLFLALGDAYYELKQYHLSEYYLKNVLQTSDTVWQMDDRIHVYQKLANVYFNQGRYMDAYKQLSLFQLVKDSIMGSQQIAYSNEMEVRYRTTQKDKEIAEKKLLISQQAFQLRQKNWMITGFTTGGAILIILFFSLYKNYWHKRRLIEKSDEIRQLKAMMSGEEKERTRIARELHDGIGGMLASIKMNLSVVRDEHPELMEIKRLNDISKMIQDTASEVRKSAHNLIPDILMRYDLSNALLMYCDSINSGSKVQIDFQFYGNIDQQDKSIQLIIYRIVQELIQNIIKHAYATHAVVQVFEHEDQLNILVEDNGRGFDVNEHNGGFGLQNLRYRIQALKGEISIMSTKGKSTTISIAFDLQKLQEINSV